MDNAEGLFLLIILLKATNLHKSSSPLGFHILEMPNSITNYHNYTLIKELCCPADDTSLKSLQHLRPHTARCHSLAEREHAQIE